MSDKRARLAVLKVRRTLATHLRKPNRPVDGGLTKSLAAVPLESREKALRGCVTLLEESAAKDEERDWVFSRAALSVARRFLAEGLPVPEALPLLIDATTFELDSWQPAFASLDRASAARVYAVLSKRVAKNTLPQLSTLRGSRPPERRIAELEKQIRGAGTTNIGRIVAPLGRLGAMMIEPLRTRIDELMAAGLGASPSDAYSRRQVVLGLRNALAVAIAETLEEDGEVDLDLTPYLVLEPPELFASNLDHAYCFLSALPKSLFARTSEEWVLRWLAGWRSSVFHHAEQDGIVKGLLPNSRKRLFFV